MSQVPPWPLVTLLTFISVAGPARGGLELNQAEKPSVSEEISPVVPFETTSQDDAPVRGVLRRPPGQGPFPAVIILHGGLDQLASRGLRKLALEGVTHVRFLEAGYVTVTPTFRSRRQDPQSPQARWDCLAVIDYIRRLPGVDPESIVLVGGSGGGSLALELAGETRLAAMAAGEPATILFMGLLTKEIGEPHMAGGERGRPILADIDKFYTREKQEMTREKLTRIQCPVFIAHGDVGMGKKLNFNYFLPELMAAGKQVEIIIYPGEPHGFYFGSGSPEAAARFFQDALHFFQPHLKTQPVPFGSH